MEGWSINRKKIINLFTLEFMTLVDIQKLAVIHDAGSGLLAINNVLISQPDLFLAGPFLSCFELEQPSSQNWQQSSNRLEEDN